jgi:hypothetical protein
MKLKNGVHQHWEHSSILSVFKQNYFIFGELFYKVNILTL